MARRPYLSACFSHSTPWSSGSLVACFTHPFRHLVLGDPLVRWAPTDLDLDSGLLLAQDFYRLPRLKGLGLT